MNINLLSNVSALAFLTNVGNANHKSHNVERVMTRRTCIMIGADITVWGGVYSGKKFEATILWLLAGMTTLSANIDVANYVADRAPSKLFGTYNERRLC